MSGSGTTRAPRRQAAYVALTVVLLAVSVPLEQHAWNGDVWIHTLIESIATFFAFVIGAIALVRYYAQKSIPYLLLGIAFLAAGCSEGFHAVVTSPACGSCDPPSLLGLISWSGYISDIFLALLVCGRLVAWNYEHSLKSITRARERALYVAVGACIVGTFTFFQFAPLPLEYYPGFPIHNPAELVAGVFYGIAAVGHWRKREWKSGGFEHWLILFLITSAIGQFIYLPWSIENFDSIELIASILRILACVLLLAGLLSSMVSIFRGAVGALRDQERVSDSLAREVTIRQQAEAALEEARRNLEARVAKNTQELAEQDLLANLASKIAVALTQSDNVEETLQRSAEIICRSIDAALVRIWTLDREQRVLELKASAGAFRGVQGYEKILVGQYRVGRIALVGKPILTNSIQQDPQLYEKDWVRQEGLVSFAGQPLMLEDRVEGVIAACAYRPLTDATMQALGSIANSLGLFVGRRRAEAALLESEERVRLLLDSAAEAIYGVDLEGNCTFANRSCLQLFGYSSPEELLGRNMHDTLHHTRSDGSPYPVNECHAFHAFHSGESCHIDDEVFWKADGTSFPAEYWSHPVTHAGKMVGAVVTLLDISARKKAEEEQRKLASIVESSNDFIALAGPDKKLLYLNSGGASMIGLDNPQDAIGREIASFHPHDAWERLRPDIPSIIESNHHQRCETQLKHSKTGAAVDVLLDAFALRRHETDEVLCLAAIMRDISGLKQSEHALRTSEERFRIAAENASDMVFETDLKTGQVELFGKGQIGGLPAPRTLESWRSMVHPDDLGPILKGIQCHIRSGQRYVGEYRVIGLDGNIYHYAMRGQVIRNASGEPQRWVGLANDITEQKKTQEAITQLAAIVQSSEDAIIGCDLAGAITSWNSGAEKLIGYPAREAIGMQISNLLVQPNSAPEILRRCGRGDVSRFDQTFLQCKSEPALPVSLTVSPVRNADGDVTRLAAIARDMRAQLKAEQALAYQARHDHLTGLPNRLMLADRLEASIARAAESSLSTAVIYLDLDGFKVVNDSLGHETGDKLLEQVAERLRACVREPDTLARMGGDEFMVVVNEISHDRLALAIAERLADALRKPFVVSERELYLTASFGISMYPRDGKDVSTLRRNADAAMYQSKHAGKDRIQFFTPVMRDTFIERLELETDLRHALDNGEFLLYFQPIVEAAQGKQAGLEALIRWRHPSRGLVPPDKFIPVCEETGLIVRLGAWVLRAACRQCRFWQDHGMKSIRVAVNVSPLEFARANFVEGVLRCLDETGLSGDLLELELTEGMVMRDIEGSTRKMLRLRERGVRISIDDFGTGYSSLGYLPRLPVDTLKIDRSFVAELGLNSTAHSLIEGIISLAHSIGKRVIVEGVETKAQLETLRNLGADEIQGYLFGKPGPLPDIPESQSTEQSVYHGPVSLEPVLPLLAETSS